MILFLFLFLGMIMATISWVWVRSVDGFVDYKGEDLLDEEKPK
jgi:hypothetical protein